MAVLSSLWIDIRYAARRLYLSPGFTAAAVATIGLGVGINTGIFSVLNGLVLREVPAVAKRVGGSAAFDDGREVEDG